MEHIAIRVEKLTKIYKLYEKPIDRLKESLHPLKRTYHRDFYALNDLTFDIKKGETVGIIGKNGSGKSTLLKIITGVLTQSSGDIEINGRVSALLELGAGFNPEFTGIENIYLNGLMQGFSREEMELKVDSILDFADIGDFAKQPVKNYSSGMFVRLAFAVATSVDPEILIVDEALSVGDIFFQAKCIKRMKNIMEKGCTILYVSHDFGSVKSLCEKAIYLEKGKIKAIGKSGEICDYYISEEMKESGFFSEKQESESGVSKNSDSQNTLLEVDKVITAKEREEFRKRVGYFRKGEQNVRIIYANLLDENSKSVSVIQFGQRICLEVYYKSQTDLKEVVIAMYIRDRNQLDIIGTNNIYEEVPIINVKKDRMYRIAFNLTSYLKAGNYYITLIIADSINTTQYYDWIDNAVVFTSYDMPGKTRWAFVGPPMQVSNNLTSE